MEDKKKVLVVTTLLGYGDLLYLTPFIRFLTMAGLSVDVWAVNTEPFFDNPYINELTPIVAKGVTIPPTYFTHWNLQKFDTTSNNIHTVDYFTVKTCGITLRNHEKDLVLVWKDSDIEYCESLLKQHHLVSNRSIHCNFVVISPVITWPSRTLPLSFYKELITEIQETGDKVVLVGKSFAHATSGLISPELAKQETKQLYPASEFPGAIDFTNKFSFAQLGAFYSLSKLAINSENGNMVASCTNSNCWNLYMPTLVAPEYRLPSRKGSQSYRTVVVKNEKDYFPPSDYTKLVGGNPISPANAPVLIPKVEDVITAYYRIDQLFRENRNYV